MKLNNLFKQEEILARKRKAEADDLLEKNQRVIQLGKLCCILYFMKNLALSDISVNHYGNCRKSN